jgi:hypothetical protein
MPGSTSAFHDHLEWAMDTHEYYWQALQLPSTFGEDPSRDRIGVMVPDIHHDIEA